MMTDRLKVKVNYILKAQSNGKKYFDTVIKKKFQIGPKTPKIMGNM